MRTFTVSGRKRIKAAFVPSAGPRVFVSLRDAAAMIVLARLIFLRRPKCGPTADRDPGRMQRNALAPAAAIAKLCYFVRLH